MDFGVIAYDINGNKAVICCGTLKELSSKIGIVKETVSKDAEIITVDRDRYEECKDNIVDLNKLLS